MRGHLVGAMVVLVATVASGPVVGAVREAQERRTSPQVSPSRADIEAFSAYFEENRGQTDPQVRFLARPRGYRAFFTDTEAVFVLHRGTGKAPEPRSTESATSLASDVVSMRFEGTRPVLPAVEGTPLPGVSNYFIGKGPGRWVTGVPHYQAIRSREFLPGVEIRWLALRTGGLEYDLVLSPRADPTAIALRFEGAKSLGITRAGDLLVRTESGVMRHSRPDAWQRVDGMRRPVGCTFEILAPGNVGFHLDGFDPALPLVIDPRVEFSTYLGGGGSDSVTRVVMDASGNVYTSGSTQSSDFPTQGAYQSSRASVNGDAFVSKLSASGSTLLYSTYLGGSSLDVANGLAVDTSGAIYLAGQTDSTDFPTASPIQGNSLNSDAFLTKIDSSGAALAYSTYLGGASVDYANDVVVDGTGAAFVAGYTQSTDFPTQSAFQASIAGAADAFLCKVNTGGSALVYSTYLGGSSLENGSRIRVDTSGNCVVTGWTYSSNFPVQSAFQPTIGVGPDVFITKVNSTGSALLFSSYLGGNGSQNPTDLALDSTGAAYVTGWTGATNLATSSAYQGTHAGGGRDAFVTKFAADGSSKAFFTYFGGSGSDTGLAIAVHSSDQVFIAGTTKSTDLPKLNALQSALSGTQDAFLARFSATGGSLAYVTYYGGSGSEEIGGIALDGASTSVVLAGSTDSTDFPNVSPYQGSNGGATDAFLVRVSTTPYPPPSALGSALVALDAIQLDWTDNSSDETGFEIQRKIGAGSYSGLATVSFGTVSHADSALARGTRYTYRVRAVSDDGPSAWSNETSTTTPPAIPGAPLSPSGLVATLVSSTHADLTWTDESGDETFFQIQRRAGGGTWQILATPGPNATAYSDNEIFPDRDYEYRIRAGNNAGYSDYAEMATVMTPASLDVIVVKGLLKDSATLAKDIVKLQGALALNGTSPDSTYDPVADGFEVRLGGQDGTPLLALSPGADGWILKKGALFWKAPKGSATKAKLVVRAAEGTWSLVLKRVNLPSIPANPIPIAVSMGNDAGTQAADWRLVPRKNGVYRLP